MQESLPETTVWSFPLARIGSLRLRMHGSFLIAAVIVFYLGWLAERFAVTNWSWGWSACTLLLWLGAVILHEFGHRLVASRLHAASREVVLTPVGGSLSPSTVTEPQNDLVLLVAGPLANLTLCLVAAAALSLMRGGLVAAAGAGGAEATVGAGPGPGVVEAAATVAAATPAHPMVRVWGLVFWLNWALVLVNLIPALPFDGGRLLRAALHLMTPRMSYAETLLVVSRIGRAVAVAAALVGLALHDVVVLRLVPGWVVGCSLAVVIYFASRRAEVARAPEDQDDWPFGYDFSAGYTSLGWQSQPARSQPAQPTLLRRWWLQRQQQRWEDQRLREASEDRQVDEILQRVHEHGYDSLTLDEQRCLQRASARYRRRPS